jgi:uncharacterized membrane protein
MPLDPALPVRDGFRLRGTAVTRLETFVDAAFAFGVTMLVISVGSVPRTPAQLIEALHLVPVFGVCFLLLTMLWWGHELWSRRFGIETGATTTLSLLFVFVMLVWIYPLRMVFSGAMSFVTGGWVPSDMDLGTNADTQLCFLVYGVGIGTLNAILLLLNRIALRRKGELELDPVEVIETRRTIGGYGIHVSIACMSVVLSAILWITLGTGESRFVSALPGFVYMLTGAGMWWHHSRMSRLRARLETA